MINIELKYSEKKNSILHMSFLKNFRTSTEQIARKAHISRSSVHNIIKKDLQIGLNFMF